MATDNTPPRLKLIATIGAITVMTLVGISFATQSYYAFMTDEAKHEKIAPTRDKDEQHKAEALAFSGAAVPLDQAMAQIAKGARPDGITPTTSDDVGPVTGWSKLPHPAPVPMPHGAAWRDVLGDGGVMLGPDGGSMTDGGVNMTSPMGDGGIGFSDAGAARDGGGRHRFGGGHNGDHSGAPDASSPDGHN